MRTALETSIEGAEASLRAGVTTIRLVGERAHVDLALRQAIERGQAEGPRIFTAGRIVGVTGGHDQPSGALGCGAIGEGIAMDSTGTVECVAVASPKLVLDAKLLESNRQTLMLKLSLSGMGYFLTQPFIY